MSDTFRPSGWNDFIGQERLKEGLQVRIKAALREKRPMGNILLCSPPGAGKTSLARVIATELGYNFESLTMPVTPKTLQVVVSQFEGLLLLDELHRASPRQQEELLTLLSEGHLALPSGRKLYNDWLTIVGATTEPQMIISPLWDRFEHIPGWSDYDDDEVTRVVLSMAQKAGVVMTVDTATTLGRAAAGVPRRARQFVLAYADLLASGDGDEVTVERVLDLCETAADGLTVQHERYLTILESVGGTAGLRTLSSLLRLNESVVTDIERVLILRGFLTYEERGRTLSRAGFKRVSSMVAA